MDDYLRAVVLGLVQAASEFLPISSSGHLVLAPRIIGGDVSSLTFDVGLHVGTTLAVLVYFWRDWVSIISHGLRDVVRERAAVRRWSRPGQLGLWIALGTVPAVIVGALFQDAIEEELRSPWVVGVMLIGVGLLIWWADESGSRERGVDDVGPLHALLVGVAQAIALIPGVSRSGITIAAGRTLGYDRPDAARFSFLLSAPAVVGAATLTLGEALTGDEAVQWGPMLVGAAVAAVAGLLVIGAFLRFLEFATLRGFVWYRIALGSTVLVAVATGWV